MERYRIELSTFSDLTKLNNIALKYKDKKITIEDSEGSCINAKSLLGLYATVDFKDLYITIPSDIHLYNKIKDFII